MSASRAAGHERTIATYFGAFHPTPEWEELVRWPPDVFALTNLVLDHTEAYRFVVAPPPGTRWPSLPNWGERVRLAARRWSGVAGARRGELPPLVQRSWETVTRARDVPLEHIRRGHPWELAAALLTLHAVADESCAAVVMSHGVETNGSFEAAARERLESQGSLARIPPARVRIVPKTHFAGRGITIRSLSRYLALCYEAVETRWRSVEPPLSTDREYNIMLVPWPVSVRARDFRPVPHTLLDNMDAEVFGFFEFVPEHPLDRATLAGLLQAAVDDAGRVDAVVLPEAAVRRDTIEGLESTLAELGASLLIAGVYEPPSGATLGRNYLHFGVRASDGWNHYEQDKHHRWCLDEAQIRQYRLTRALPPNRLWWEAIDIRERTLHVIDVGGGITTAPLVCEDLARLDEVADLVRRIGPSLVVAVLLDGPQLASRWSSRYASVLADDPGSTVLTLTSRGMAARSRPPGMRCSRVVALWNSREDGVHEIELARGAGAVLLSTVVDGSTLWTADGRCHTGVPRLRLSRVRQIRAGPRRLVSAGS